MENNKHEFYKFSDLPLDSDITLDEISERLQAIYDFILENNLQVDLPDPDKKTYLGEDKTHCLYLEVGELMTILLDFEDSYIISQLTSNSNQMSDSEYLYNIIEENNKLKKNSKSKIYDRITKLLCAIIPTLLTLYATDHSQNNESITVQGDVNVYIQSDNTQSAKMKHLTEQLKELNVILPADAAKIEPVTNFTNRFEEIEDISESVAAYSENVNIIETKGK